MNDDAYRPEYDRIGAYMLVRTAIAPADLCFVFGTRHAEDAFADAVAEHFHRRYFPRIVIAGGATAGQELAESDDMKQRLVARGVPAPRILCERASTNTGDNVIKALPLIEAAYGRTGISSLIAVGKISSSRRYLMTLKRHWPAVRRMLLPVNPFGVPAERWWRSEAFRVRVLREWEKIPRYIEQDFLVELDAGDGLLG
ncbi:MAG TPA: YdcF family protein [Rhizomicrobium sp.]